MRIFGLTGGTGSGKSAAAKRFAQRGFPVVDADAIGHTLLAPGGTAVDATIAAFGDGILSDGVVDRKKLGAIVFQDPDALQRLNAITHPALFAEVGRLCAEHAAAGRPDIILDAALLCEQGVKEDWLAGLILVTASPEVRQQRLVEFRGMEPDRAAHQIAAQTPPASKEAFADWIIHNEGTLEELYSAVDAVVEEIQGAPVRP